MIWRTIQESDVNAITFEVAGHREFVSSFLGRIMRQDVGKRVYRVPCGDRYVLQAENDDQRAAREGWTGPACLL